ncbi:dihydrolipoyl dehydrogenase [Candidatus Termititenax persephonae]|uniref:Dihydrolipoyl dehydrogenase n=1 Tax=Candidatus Termititenax persephonae TaxID=2218525 RepID=A0A388TH60_9BACT|nr:dihydrolipoyl dehydrogenase [Candidatus Termititenax persephonae]
MKKYDLIVIGAGPGGYEAAARAAKQGLQTLLVEKQQLGGACLNNGCIPVKTLLGAVHFLQQIKKANLLNIQVEKAELDFAALIDRKNRLLTRLQKGIALLLQTSGVETLRGEAKLLPGKIVSVTPPAEASDGEIAVKTSAEYTADNIILATGSAPGVLPGITPDGGWLLDNSQLLRSKTIPATLAVVGAGVIGLEFADIYSRLGCRVTLIDVVPELLAAEDSEAAALLQKSLERAGCRFLLNSSVTKIEDKTLCLNSGETVAAEQCLLATGRRAQTDYILDSAVQKNAKGYVLTAADLQTTVPGIYAVGDCNGLALYAHAATYQGLAVADNLTLKNPRAINQTVLPRVIFTSPQIASVGYYTDRCAKIPLARLGRAQTENQTEGFLKIFLDPQDTIVGCVIVAGNADALIGEAVVLVNTRTKYADLQKMIHPHPSWAEAFALLD